jgi:hypothetical protein
MNLGRNNGFSFLHSLSIFFIWPWVGGGGGGGAASALPLT